MDPDTDARMDPDAERLHRWLLAARRRTVLALALRYGGVLWLFGALAFAALTWKPATFVAATGPGQSALVLFLWTVAAAALGLLVARLRRPSLARLAAHLDRRLALAQRLETAAGLLLARDPVAVLLRRDAARCLEGRAPREVLPLAPTPGTRWVGLASTALLVAILTLRWTLPPSRPGESRAVVSTVEAVEAGGTSGGVSLVPVADDAVAGSPAPPAFDDSDAAPGRGVETGRRIALPSVTATPAAPPTPAPPASAPPASAPATPAPSAPVPVTPVPSPPPALDAGSWALEGRAADAETGAEGAVAAAADRDTAAGAGAGAAGPAAGDPPGDAGMPVRAAADEPLGGALEDVEQALAREHLPAGMRRHVRAYFLALRGERRP